MGKKKKILLLMILALVLTIIPTTNVEAASKVKMNKSKTTIYVGASEALKVTGTSKAVKWYTSNKKVATVSSKGKVVAKKKGTVTITAKVSGKKYKCKVTVKNPYINTSSKEMYVGDTYSLKLTGTSIKSVKSSNKNIATVNKKGTVTAKKSGTVTISLIGKNKKTYKCKITVQDKEHKHKYTEKFVDSTCAEKGYTLYTCSCGKSYKDNYVDKKNWHNWGQWNRTKEPTEYNEGEETRKCNNCDEKETRPINRFPHTHQYTESVTEPTCTEMGYTTHTCKCGESYADSYTEAKHSWNDWVITKDPGTQVHPDPFTEVLPFGERERKCNVCKKEEKQSIINIDASAYDENDMFTVSGVKFISENIAQVYGVFHDDMAYETLAMVNNLRKSLGKTEIVWNNGFTNIGKIRGAEISVRLAHIRPSGARIIPAENIAFNYKNAQEVFNAWKESPGHYRNMVNDYNNNLYYASCFETEDGGYFWVQLFY